MFYFIISPKSLIQIQAKCFKHQPVSQYFHYQHRNMFTVFQISFPPIFSFFIILSTLLMFSDLKDDNKHTFLVGLITHLETEHCFTDFPSYPSNWTGINLIESPDCPTLSSICFLSFCGYILDMYNKDHFRHKQGTHPWVISFFPTTDSVP